MNFNHKSPWQMSTPFFHWVNPESRGVESSLSPGLSNSQHFWSASSLHCDRGPSHQHTSSGDFRPSRPASSVLSGRQTGPVKTCCSESSRASHFTQQKSKSLKSPKAPHGLRPPPASAPFSCPGPRACCSLMSTWLPSSLPVGLYSRVTVARPSQGPG